MALVLVDCPAMSPALNRTLSKASSTRTAAPLEPQCLEFRKRNEERKEQLFPFKDPQTPEQHQLVRATAS